MVPTVLGAAPAAGAASPAAAIAAVTTVGYLGSLTGPPLIGVVAEPLGISAALVALPAAALVLGALAGPALARRPAAAPAPTPAP